MGYKTAVNIVLKPPAPDLSFFWASRSCGRAGWAGAAPHKSGLMLRPIQVRQLHTKHVWICDISAVKQIHNRKSDIDKVQHD